MNINLNRKKLVAKVTDIYLNFAHCNEFCVAVCNDGMCKKNKIVSIFIYYFARSYNEQLFPQAVEVLDRIRHPTEREFMLF